MRIGCVMFVKQMVFESIYFFVFYYYEEVEMFSLTACSIFPVRIFDSAVFPSSNWSSQLCFSLIVPVYAIARSQTKAEISWQENRMKQFIVQSAFFLLKPLEWKFANDPTRKSGTDWLHAVHLLLRSKISWTYFPLPPSQEPQRWLLSGSA